MSGEESAVTSVPVKYALLSVTDKTGIADFAARLHQKGVHLLASGGTYQTLTQAGLSATEISVHTGHPEILGGRVKTLHPRIHGGILARRDNPEDLATLSAQGIPPIDLVVVNLYRFEDTVRKPGATDADILEHIDIGGPTLIRAAAKNFPHVAILVSPEQYPAFLEEFEPNGQTSLTSRRAWAESAFTQVTLYDLAISDYFRKLQDRHAGLSNAQPQSPGANAKSKAGAQPTRSVFGPWFTPRFQKVQDLRYGENPHQRAAFYRDSPPSPLPSLATAHYLHGKELSYNNILDLDSVLRLVSPFQDTNNHVAAIIKHNNPCGAAIADQQSDAFELAYEGDPVSAFGGIVGLSGIVDETTAQRLCMPGRFLEAIIAPGFTPEAFQILTTKPTWKNSVRLLEWIGKHDKPSGWEMRCVQGGLLLQDWDPLEYGSVATGGTVVTQRTPTEEEYASMTFAWMVCQSVRSNAIVLVKGRQVIGVGAGQMSRLDSVGIAVQKAGTRAPGAVLASDAFFPFRDGPDIAAQAGVTAVIQPGGSKRDEETIAACNEHNIAMIFTGRRHFRH